jgi:hypothetical protein
VRKGSWLSHLFLLTTYLHDLKVKVQRKRGEYQKHFLDVDGFETKLMFNKHRMCHEKVARLPFAFAFGYCINLCIYAMLRTRATFSWPTLYISDDNLTPFLSRKSISEFITLSGDWHYPTDFT